ncbi:hypothetical protein LZ32DRAFT_286358 [Colletotrichum eremochloae]|nr:hypothetical protein LZ32DRAFT_286358 [Colletotrichum eremochloae]
MVVKLFYCVYSLTVKCWEVARPGTNRAARGGWPRHCQLFFFLFSFFLFSCQFGLRFPSRLIFQVDNLGQQHAAHPSAGLSSSSNPPNRRSGRGIRGRGALKPLSSTTNTLYLTVEGPRVQVSTTERRLVVVESLCLQSSVRASRLHVYIRGLEPGVETALVPKCAMYLREGREEKARSWAMLGETHSSRTGRPGSQLGRPRCRPRHENRLSGRLI